MTMRRATILHPAGSFDPARLAGVATLAAHDRHRRRIRMVDDGGDEFLLDLPNAQRMHDGDGLGLEDGGVILVRAALEEVADIHCGGVELTARVGWHVGNRHVPVQVLPGGTVRVPDDPVVVAMAEGLGAHVVRHRAPFQPEPGAYDQHGLLSAPEPVVRRG
jgi:Urease accessory protein UreE